MYVVLGSFGVFVEEGTTPNSRCFEPSQGQGRRASTVSRPPGTRLLKVSEGLGKAKQLGRCADSDDGQSTHKQLSFTLVPTVRKENRCRHPRTSMHVATQTLVLKCTYVLHACQCTYEDVGTYACSRRKARSQ